MEDLNEMFTLEEYAEVPWGGSAHKIVDGEKLRAVRVPLTPRDYSPWLARPGTFSDSTRWMSDSGMHADGWIIDQPTYRPSRMARQIRHSENLQAIITRRNERHEADQERIDDLKAKLKEAKKAAKQDAKPVATQPQGPWDQAIIPEDGIIPAGTPYLIRRPDGDQAAKSFWSTYRLPAVDPDGTERRIIMPPVTIVSLAGPLIGTYVGGAA